MICDWLRIDWFNSFSSRLVSGWVVVDVAAILTDAAHLIAGDRDRAEYYRWLLLVSAAKTISSTKRASNHAPSTRRSMPLGGESLPLLPPSLLPPTISRESLKNLRHWDHSPLLPPIIRQEQQIPKGSPMDHARITQGSRKDRARIAEGSWKKNGRLISFSLAVWFAENLRDGRAGLRRGLHRSQSRWKFDPSQRTSRYSLIPGWSLTPLSTHLLIKPIINS